MTAPRVRPKFEIEVAAAPDAVMELVRDNFALLVGLSWGYAQWVMERPPWAFLSLPAAAILGGGLYAASVLGQRLGAEQMVQLRSAFEDLCRPRLNPPRPGVREPSS